MRKQNRKNNNKRTQSGQNRTTRAVVVLKAEVEIALTAMSEGTGNVSPATWSNFLGFDELSVVYHYFVPIAHRIDLTYNSVTPSETITSAAIAFYPINAAIGENLPGGTPATVSDLSDLEGSIVVQPGAKNFGRWTKWPFKIQQLPAFDFSSSYCGSFFTYAKSFESLEGYFEAVATISVKFLFFKRAPYFYTSLARPLPVIVSDGSPEAESVEIVSAKPKQVVKPVSKKLTTKGS